MPARTFADVYDQYRQLNLPGVSLQDFARAGNEATGSQDFASAAQGGLGALTNKGSYWLDKGLEATGVPQAFGTVTSDLFSAAGGDPAYGQQVGESIPRSIVDFAPMIISGFASGGTIPAGAAAASAGPSALAYLSSGVLGAANAYEKSNSLASAATAGVAPYVGGKLGHAASGIAAKAMGATGESLANSLMQRLGVYGAGQVGALGGMEGLNAASGLAQGHGLPTFDRNWVLSTLASQIPFLSLDAKSLVFPKTVPHVTPRAPEEPAIPQRVVELEGLETERANKLQQAETIESEEERTKVIQEINSVFDEGVKAVSFEEPVKPQSPFYQDPQVLGALDRFKTGVESGGELKDFTAMFEGQPIEDSPEVNRQNSVKEIERRILEEGNTLDDAVDRTEVVRQAKSVGGRPKSMTYIDAEGNKVYTTPRQAEKQKLTPHLDEAGNHVPMHMDREQSGLWQVMKNDTTYPALRKALLAIDNGAWLSEAQGRAHNDMLGHFEKLFKAYQAGDLSTVAAGNKAYKNTDTLENQFAKILHSATTFRIKQHKDNVKNETPLVETVTPSEELVADSDDAAGYEAAHEVLADTVGAQGTTREDLADALAAAKERGELVGEINQQSLSQVSKGRESTIVNRKLGELMQLARESKDRIQFNRALLLSDFKGEPMKVLAAAGGHKDTQAFKDWAWENRENADFFKLRSNQDEIYAGNNGKIFSQGRPAGAQFFYGLQDYNSVTNKLGKHTLPRDGWIDLSQLKVIGGADQLLKDAEIDIYKEVVPKAFKDSKVHVPTLAEGLNEAAPVISVRRLDASSNGTNAHRQGEIAHQLDTIAPDWQGALNEETGLINGAVFGPETLERIRPLVEEFNTLAQGPAGSLEGEAATGKYGVEPYDMSYLNGQETRQGGLQKALWAGDIVGQVPLDYAFYDSGTPNVYSNIKAKFQSQHYGTSAGENQLFFVRGALHEFLPGSKLPTGEIATKPTKVFEAWEVQSDWAAEKQRAQEAADRNANSPAHGNRIARQSELERVSHPTLSLWEPLALKTALVEARNMGAEMFALSDAESAMMTEGHDQYARNLPDVKFEVPSIKGVELADGSGAIATGKLEASDRILRVETDQGWFIVDQLPAKAYGQAVDAWPIGVPQSPGMRLHYDRTGPSILSKLTGDKGRVGDFGKHGKAESESRYQVIHESGDQYYVTEADTGNVVHQPTDYSTATNWVEDQANVKKVKGSKVFRTPEGQPKTQNTTRVYPLSKLSKEVARFNIAGSVVEPGNGESLPLAPTFENLYRRVAEKSGIPFDQIQASMPFMKNLHDMWSLQDVKFGELLRDGASPDQPSGLGTISGPTRKMWLAANEKVSNPLDFAKNMLVLTSHEAGHLLDHLYRMDKMPARARTEYEKVLKWKDQATPQELKEVVTDAADSLLPSNWRKLPEFAGLLNPANGDEALATLHGIWSLSNIHKEADRVLGPAMIGAQPRSYLRQLADTAKQFIGSLKGALFGQKNYKSAEQLKTLTDSFVAMKKGVDQATKNIAALQKMFDYDPANMNVLRASALDVIADPSSTPSMREMAMFAAPPSDSQIPNVPKSLVDKIGHSFSRALETLPRLAEHAPILARVSNAILNTPGLSRSILSRIQGPEFGYADPQTGKVRSASKEAHAMEKLWQEDKEVNRAIAEIDYWQQRQEQIKDPAQRKVFDPNNYKDSDLGIAATLDKLSPEKRSAVLTNFVKHSLSARAAQGEHLSAQRFANVNHLAAMISRANPSAYEHAQDTAQMLHQAAEYSVAGDQQSFLLAWQEAVKSGLPPVDMLKYLDVGKSMVENEKKMIDFYAGRPAFTSYARVSDYVVDAFDSTGKQVRHEIPAETAERAAAIEAQLKKEGLRTNITKTTRGKKVKIDEEYSAYLASLDDKLFRTIRDVFADSVTEDQIKQLSDQFSFAGQLKQSAEVASKRLPTPEGRSLKGIEEFDVVRQRLEANRLFANAIAKLRSGSELSFHKTNPKLKDINVAHLVEQVDDMWANYQYPDSDLATKITRKAAVFYLGANLPNHAAELLQPLMTILPQATAEHGALKSFKTMKGVIKDLLKSTAKKMTQKQDDSGHFWHDKGEEQMIATLGEEGYWGRNPLSDALDEAGEVGVAWRHRANGSKVPYLGSVTKALADSTMNFYQMFNRTNSKIAALTGYRLAIDSGMKHTDATQYAKRFVERSAYAGSKATRSVTPFNPGHRTIGQLAMLLQSYMQNYVGQQVRHIQRGFTMSDAQLKGLGHADMPGGVEGVRSRSKKAALMMLGAQFLAAGAMGIPFMGPAVKIFEDMTGEDLRADTYQLFGELMDKDQEEGSVLADGFMRGYVNTLLERAGLPIDMGGRFAVPGLPGLSEFSGFNANGLFGPMGGLVKSLVTGIADGARDRDLLPVLKSVAPTGLKKAIDLALNGDATDANQNRMGLSDSEKIAYGLGFTPSRVRKLKEAERLIDSTTSARRAEQDRVEAKLLDVAKVNPQAARMELVKQANKLGVPVKELAQAIAQREVKATMPKDFREDIPRLDGQAAMNLLRGIGVNPGPGHETEKAQLQARIQQMLGVAPNMRRVQRARATDSRLEEDPYQPLASPRTHPLFSE